VARRHGAWGPRRPGWQTLTRAVSEALLHSKATAPLLNPTPSTSPLPSLSMLLSRARNSRRPFAIILYMAGLVLVMAGASEYGAEFFAVYCGGRRRVALLRACASDRRDANSLTFAGLRWIGPLTDVAGRPAEYDCEEWLWSLKTV